jgi:hypothetical protein
MDDHEPKMPRRHILLVLTNAVEGRDDEFNDWYTNRHLDDLLKLDGVNAARRYQLSHVQRATPPYPYRYCALYEIETDDLSQVLAALGERARTPAMPMSEAMAANSLILYFTPIAERVKADIPR